MAAIIEENIIIVYGERREKPRIVTFKADPETVEKMDMAARKLRMSRSELIRLAIDKLLQEIL